jgi:hypothetical protein
MTPSLQGQPYWENGALRKNTNYDKPSNFGPKETLCPTYPDLPVGPQICKIFLLVLKSARIAYWSSDLQDLPASISNLLDLPTGHSDRH